MLTVRNTRVFSYLGSARTVVSIQINARAWATLDRAIDGPRNWHRLCGLLHRNESVCYLIRLHTFVPIECVTFWHEYNSKINGGELTIYLPPTIGPSDVPQGTSIEILRRQWVSIWDGRLHRSQWNPELLQYVSSCNFPPPESSELTDGNHRMMQWLSRPLACGSTIIQPGLDPTTLTNADLRNICLRMHVILETIETPRCEGRLMPVNLFGAIDTLEGMVLYAQVSPYGHSSPPILDEWSSVIQDFGAYYHLYGTGPINVDLEIYRDVMTRYNKA